jgi:hypothetical protein
MLAEKAGQHFALVFFVIDYKYAQRQHILDISGRLSGRQLFSENVAAGYSGSLSSLSRPSIKAADSDFSRSSVSHKPCKIGRLSLSLSWTFVFMLFFYLLLV